MPRLRGCHAPVRDCFGHALMDLCREQRLGSITVARLAEKTGLTRQTFYNHFSNIEDLTRYTGSRALIMGDNAILYEPEAIKRSYLYTVDHHEFYLQLFAQTGCGSFQDVVVRWLKRKGYESFIHGGLTGADAVRRKTQIDLFQAGSVHVMFDWLERGMREPIDAVVGSVCDMMPCFMRNEAQHIVSIDYPR